MNNIIMPFKGLKICVTGVTGEEESKYKKLIESLGGKLSRDFSKDCYCLLVKKVGSKKYQVAYDINIPCLTVQWLIDCYDRKTLLNYNTYIVKPFEGLSFVISGYTPEERYILQQLIVSNNGINNNKLTQTNCTHLIALTSNSDKYKAAKYWNNIHIVNKKWIYECIERGRWILEVPYMVLPEHIHPPVDETKAKLIEAKKQQ